MSANAPQEEQPVRRRLARGLALRLVGGMLLLAGVVVLGGALLQPAKSALGLMLLDNVFEARRAAPAIEQREAANWRPWPWAELAPVGRIAFPRLDESRIVLDSVTGEALAWGVGHAPASAELGAAGVTALAGHRDGAFDFLGDVREGDVVELTPLDGPTARYVVVSLEVIDSRFEGFRLTHHGPDELVLATCWPIEAAVSGSERLMVTARRVAAERASR